MLALFAALVWIVIMKRNNDSLNLQKRQAISEQAALKQRLLEKEIEKSNKIQDNLDQNHTALSFKIGRSLQK